MNALGKCNTAPAKSSANAVRTKSTLEVYLQFLIYLHFSAALYSLPDGTHIYRGIYTLTLYYLMNKLSHSIITMIHLSCVRICTKGNLSIYLWQVYTLLDTSEAHIYCSSTEHPHYIINNNNNNVNQPS